MLALARDVTGRKEAEGRAGFLADLDRTLQPITDPVEVMATAARMLGRHVGADRCAYAEVEADEDHFRITGDYTRDVPSIVGRFAMSQFGSEALRLSRENEPYVVHDAEEDGRVTGADLEAYRQTSIRAVISVPLHKDGRFVAGMAVHQKAPRRWTSEEVGLLVAVANRCWESIERARAARDLKQSEELYRNVVEQAAESIFLLDLDFLRVLEANATLGATLGYTPEEIRGMSIDLRHKRPPQGERRQQRGARLARGAAPPRIEAVQTQGWRAGGRRDQHQHRALRGPAGDVRRGPRRDRAPAGRAGAGGNPGRRAQPDSPRAP